MAAAMAHTLPIIVPNIPLVPPMANTMPAATSTMTSLGSPVGMATATTPEPFVPNVSIPNTEVDK